MDEVSRAIAEREVGRMVLKILERLKGSDYFEPNMEITAIRTLQRIQIAMDDEDLSDFDCVNVIADILACVGINTWRHDLR